MPYLGVGLVFLLYGLLFPISQPWDYIKLVILGAVAFYVFGLVFRGEVMRTYMPVETGDAQTDQLLAEVQESISAFRIANDRIADATVSANIEDIEWVCKKIMDRLQEQPDLYGQLRSFLRYYLPTTRKLLDARAMLEQERMDGKSAKQVRERTDRVLPEIEKAFRRQLEALDQNRYLDLQVEIDVLEGMLKSDGLSNR